MPDCYTRLRSKHIAACLAGNIATERSEVLSCFSKLKREIFITNEKNSRSAKSTAAAVI